MQKLESGLQVTLFERKKNKLSLNANGRLAVEYAAKVLKQMCDFTERVRAYDRANRTISVGSCAPAPMWDILPALSMRFPEMTLSGELENGNHLTEGLKTGLYQLIILPFAIEDPHFFCAQYESERIMFSLPPDHPLSASKGLHLKDLDGEIIPLFSQLGMWYDLCLEKMPSAHFILQSERDDFLTLVRASSLPAFTSDLMIRRNGPPDNRVVIPVLDEEASVTYYIVCHAGQRPDLRSFLKDLTEDGKPRG